MRNYWAVRGIMKNGGEGTAVTTAVLDRRKLLRQWREFQGNAGGRLRFALGFAGRGGRMREHRAVGKQQRREAVDAVHRERAVAHDNGLAVVSRIAHCNGGVGGQDNGTSACQWQRQRECGKENSGFHDV